ncbi:hypothetical protein HUJ05_011323 [Dendroctonus ponderosae]|nr:hypothetical protein HUJ05_011323 [Dendroctonus ponderosae]
MKPNLEFGSQHKEDMESGGFVLANILSKKAQNSTKRGRRVRCVVKGKIYKFGGLKSQSFRRSFTFSSQEDDDENDNGSPQFLIFCQKAQGRCGDKSTNLGAFAFLRVFREFCFSFD